MKEVELISKRKPREKHFLQEDGTIVAKIFNKDIHYLKDNKYEEIDNTLIERNGIVTNKNNKYKVEFEKKITNKLMRITKDNYFLNFRVRGEIANHLKNKNRKLIPEIKSIMYGSNDDISIQYQMLENKIKETIILQNAQQTTFEFIIETNLNLKLKYNEIIAKNEFDSIVFRIEKPFMLDSNNVKNDNCFYILEKISEGYLLTLVLDEEWLSNKKRKYPIYVDPTVSNENDDISLYDTYIYPGDTNENRNTKQYLKAGAESINNSTIPNRTLIKFTLPQIGTGSEIINATLYVVPYLKATSNESTNIYLMETHQITSDWDVDTANWANMNDKYNTKVESVYEFERSIIQNSTLSYRTTGFDITNAVKGWYRDIPNYGIMIKSCNEEYIDDDFPMFYSAENQISGDPKPIVAIAYRNHNGLESYWNYKQQNFTDGISYVNTYNGNITSVFSLGKTVGGALPVCLELVYNTNDVILENQTFFGKGFKLNLEQYIKEETETKLIYIDEDGTNHYFQLGSNGLNSAQESNIFYDEDGLGLSIEKIDSDYIMKNNFGEVKTYTNINGVYHLTKIRDNNDNEINILLNQNNSISNISDSYGSSISITYNQNEIVINSHGKLVTLNYVDNKLHSINSKNGITQFDYSSNDLIIGITDVTGMKVAYEYYEKSPYRVKKVTQYGLNSKVGQYFTLEYVSNGTIVTDHKDRVEVISYNANGNLTTKSNLKSIDDLTNAYSIKAEYNDNNDIISDIVPIRYINNLLKNTSFETNTDNFTSESGIIMNYDTNYYHSGLRSLKVEAGNQNKSIFQNVDVTKGNYYTFSAYIKNNVNVSVLLSYTDVEGNIVESCERLKISDDFERVDTTIYYDENASSDLSIKILLEDSGIIFIDDIQLEIGEVANYYNILENSNFEKGLLDWNLFASRNGQELDPNDYIQVISINEKGDKAVKVEMNPLNSTGFNKKYDIKGKKGDVYTLAFWYKYDGVIQYAPYTATNITISYEPYDDNLGHCITSMVLPSTNNVWQYYIQKEVAIEDFKSITISISQNGDANDLLVTNLSFYKNVTSGEYNYDENRNLVSIEDQSKNSETFQYNEFNKLLRITNSLDNSFVYEYDKIKKDQVINMITDNGISNKLTYDNYGKPIKMKTSKLYISELDGEIFKIREKGTNRFLKAELYNIFLEENECSNTLWKFEKVGDLYKIHYVINPDYVITYNNGNITLEKSLTNNLFRLIKNINESYSIVYENELESGIESKYICTNGQLLSTKSLDIDNSDIEFYIEKNETLFNEISYTYTQDNKFINSFTDSNFNTTLYSYNENIGTLESVVDPKGNITTYEYNDKQQVISSDFNGKEISFIYNNQNLISEIHQGNKILKLKYDDFLNIRETSLGNEIIFLQNNYESNNGNLISTLYGNGNIISYDYDEFDRISKVVKMDNEYLYKYNNNGSISKIISNDGEVKFFYDECNRLCQFKNNDFIAKYAYDSNNNIVQKKYEFNNTYETQNVSFDSYENTTQLSTDNTIVNYEYDDLNRMNRKTIGSIFELDLNYLNHGKRTSNMISNYIINGIKYTYIYDNLYNITKIFYNNELQKSYEYDSLNQLISENNYDINNHVEYQYNNSGNIISKTIYNNDNEIIKSYSYQYSNINWEDQLTAFDGQNISYDVIGNPINIGDATLTWINGNNLNSYIDENKNLSVNYTYDLNGIRTSKIVNDTRIDYKFINNSIIFEKRNNNVIYYIHDVDGVLGFKYNGNVYLYLKNVQDDVIGIINESGEKIVSYKYDSWGDLISIKDLNGEEIIDENHIGKINPIRYRSYYYDEETGLYYLTNRYYNPKWGRFISPDSVFGSNQDILSCNLYAYVSNNPINNYDHNGTSLKSLFKKAKSVVKKVVKKVSKIINNITNAGSKTNTKSNTPNKNNLPDYSDELNKVLQQNATEANYYSKTLSQMAALKYFKDQVNHKQEWDYKREEIWEQEFDVPYLGTQGKFIFNGEVITTEDFGNIHYGYVGKAMGFSDELLYMGGGYAHCGVNPLVLVGPYYCDDPNDHKAIKKGIDMWNRQ